MRFGLPFFVLLLTIAIAEAAEPAKPYGLEKRIPLTTSRVIGSPDPPLPFRTAAVFTKLKFDHPLYIIAEPGTDRMLVVEQHAKFLAFANDPQVAEAAVFLKLEDRDAYGMTFHPRYAENRQVFVFTNGPNSAMSKNNRISRFTVDKVGGRCPPESEQIILEWVSNGHNGGDLAFGRDGFLYASAGDGTVDSDTNLTGQKIGDLVSGMLRIDVDHPEEGKGYSVPRDNPFLHIKDASPELWAYGFRNPWRIHIDPQGNLWCGDIGQDQWEMVHVVKRGDNFGWSVFEGGQPFYLERERGPTPLTKPTIVHPHSEARSITGGVTYLGEKLPGLKGAYVYGDYGTGRIWAARYDGQKITEHREIADSPYQMLGFGLDRQGEIYLVDYNGGIHTLEPTPPDVPKHDFPRRLSETGLFLSVAGHVPQPGLVPYSVNSPLWSDGALKERFLALPENTQIEFAAEAAWKFPERTVLVKTFSLETEAGNAASRRRIETRLMVYQQNEWVGYSYQWNDEQTDAELVPSAGLDRSLAIREPGGERLQPWRYPSRAECMVCHSRAANYVLGVTTAQMNRVHEYGGVSDHQLRTLAHIGMLREPGITGPELSKPLEEFAKLADPLNEKEPLVSRVKSYLHANCAQCHVEAGGGNAAMELSLLTPLDKMRIVDVVPLHEKFGVAEGRLIAPGSPERSILRHRMSIRGRGQMPPLASSRPDPDGLRLLEEWIKSLK